MSTAENKNLKIAFSVNLYKKRIFALKFIISLKQVFLERKSREYKFRKKFNCKKIHICQANKKFDHLLVSESLLCFFYVK